MDGDRSNKRITPAAARASATKPHALPTAGTPSPRPMAAQELIFSKYRLLARLGSGGMAEVFLAVSGSPSGFGKLLVLKVLRPDLPEAERAQFLRMFEDEGRLAMRLSHPNIVQSYEVGSEDGQSFIAMEYLEGQPLSSLQERGWKSVPGISLEMQLYVLCQVLEGLEYAHGLTSYDGRQLNIVHRDVSPQNVFVTYAGYTKLVDFGIAKTLESNSKTAAGVVKGKVPYMSPEQVRGGSIDHRADLLSSSATCASTTPCSAATCSSAWATANSASSPWPRPWRASSSRAIASIGLLGGSARMRELFADLVRIAPIDVTVLIEGETGSGKEVVAESIHAASPRAKGPFVVFDCSAAAPTLIESELFGHERGSFTGAVASRAGVFEQADGGTIFLDELGELPKDLQPKLLRVLERREVRRLGSQRTIPVDVRLLAATNRNLAVEVQRGNFREDLYYRFAAARVRVPPLRDRMEDLPLLIEHFLSRAKPPRSMADMPQQVFGLFNGHRWPGNVRELAHAVQRFLVTPERVFAHEPPGAALTSAATPGSVPSSAAPSALLPLRVARREASEAFERAYLESALQRSQGNVTRAAAVAEVSRQMVQKLMRKHGID